MTGVSVTKEGKTVQDAVLKALKQLGAQKEHVVIEILSQGAQGLLGIGAKPAKVKVTLKEEVQAERKLKYLLTDLDIGGHLEGVSDLSGSAELMAAANAILTEPENSSASNEQSDNEVTGDGPDDAPQQRVGTVEVKEGRMIVSNPVNDETKAVISAGENVRVILNGQAVEKESPVCEEDIVEVEIINHNADSSLELKLSRNKMEADLKYILRPGANYRLKDQAPATKLTLLTEVETIVEPSPKTLVDLHAFMQENDVIRGIDEEMLKAVLENPNSIKGSLVARGQLPVDGIDATLRFPFQEEHDDEDDSSYFSRNRLISVVPGDVIAVKVPKIEGQDGWNVLGETLPARPAMPCEITLKAGCEFSEDGESIISTLSGRPVIEKSGTNFCISVDPVYIVKEVTQATGNINFAGDVDVQGNVGEGCIVQADGNIQVNGDVSRAVIRAGASVVLHKMVFGSSVSAGGRTALYASILPVFKQIRELLERVSWDAKALKAGSGADWSGKPVSDGMIIQFIIDAKFKNLPQVIRSLADAVNASNIPAHEEIVELAGLLKRNLCGLGAVQIEKMEYLDNLSVGLNHVIDMAENCMKRADYIKVRYVQNCALLSSGDVIIEGQGCYISDIKAGGAVIICGKPGIARGVKILADGDVTVADLGSEFESQTSVRVGAGSKITAELVYPDVLIQVGKEKYRVDKASRSFTAYMDANGSGRLMVDKLTAEQK